jgi:DMSO reductase anchor subunit
MRYEKDYHWAVSLLLVVVCSGLLAVSLVRLAKANECKQPVQQTQAVTPEQRCMAYAAVLEWETRFREDMGCAVKKCEFCTWEIENVD